MDPTRAAIVQGDRTILVEVDHAAYEDARATLSRFAELVKSPEHVHTYRVSDLALWNAAAAGLTSAEVEAGLRRVSRFDVPGHVVHEVHDRMSRWGVCVLHGDATSATLQLEVGRASLADHLRADAKIAPMVTRLEQAASAPARFELRAVDRGPLKRALLKLGYPVDDRAGLHEGEACALAVRNDLFTPYPYQRASAQAFLDAGGHGVVVLPCGAGKTVVAMLAMAAIGRRTLVLASSREACVQWRRELLAKTSLRAEAVAIYGAAGHATAPVTIATYSMVARKGGGGATGHLHFDRLAEEGWGLLVYDEVHLLPAPVVRLTAELQARRRLGLTATLVREDGREGDVFSMIGPKRYEVPWRELEASGHIAVATCFEVRVPFADGLAHPYAEAPLRDRARIAAENPRKLDVLRALAERHEGDRVLVLGSYLDPLRAAAKILGAPLITGETAHAERERRFAAFRDASTRHLVLSRVGNFAIDLPEANVLVQLSGTMGSRQEEAQRLGRVLRPKPGGATFYTLVTRDSCEEETALHRQMFLAEQGYRYFIEDWTGESGESSESGESGESGESDPESGRGEDGTQTPRVLH